MTMSSLSPTSVVDTGVQLDNDGPTNDQLQEVTWRLLPTHAAIPREKQVLHFTALQHQIN